MPNALLILLILCDVEKYGVGLFWVLPVVIVIKKRMNLWCTSGNKQGAKQHTS